MVFCGYLIVRCSGVAAMVVKKIEYSLFLRSCRLRFLFDGYLIEMYCSKIAMVVKKMKYSLFSKSYPLRFLFDGYLTALTSDLRASRGHGKYRDKQKTCLDFDLN